MGLEEKPDRMDLVRRFFSETAPSYDRVVRITTMGFDGRWKRRILEMIPAGSGRIVDQACGTGILTAAIAGRFPEARVTGVDVTEGYLTLGRRKAERLGLANVDFVLGRAEDVLPEGPCDCVTSSYLAKYADIGRLVANLNRMLRPGGTVLMHDFTYPRRRLFASAWRLYLAFLQTFTARLYPSWRPAFYGLPELLFNTDWVARLERLLALAGFLDVGSESLTFGAAAIVHGKKGLG